MQRTRLFIPLLILLLSLTGCASVSMVSSWKDQAAPKKTYKDLLVVGITEKQQMRQVFEEVLAGELRKAGVSATPSYTVTGGEKLSRKLIEKAVLATGVDSVITAQLIDMRRKTITDGGFIMTDRGHSIAGLDDAEGGSVDIFGISGTGAVSYASFSMKSVEITTSRTAVIESKLYDTSSQKPVWSGISNAVDPAGVITVTETFAGVIINSMKKEGLIP
jgi:hypothetical protein